LGFDLTSHESFTNLNKWLEEIREQTSKKVVIMLVGNKCDLDFRFFGIN